MRKTKNSKHSRDVSKGNSKQQKASINKDTIEDQTAKKENNNEEEKEVSTTVDELNKKSDVIEKKLDNISEKK